MPQGTPQDTEAWSGRVREPRSCLLCSLMSAACYPHLLVQLQPCLECWSTSFSVLSPRSREIRAHPLHLLMGSCLGLAGDSGSPICSVSRLLSSGMDTAVTTPALFCFGLRQPKALCPFERKSPKQMHETVSECCQVKSKSPSCALMLQGSTQEAPRREEALCVRLMELGEMSWRQRARTCSSPFSVAIRECLRMETL